MGACLARASAPNPCWVFLAFLLYSTRRVDCRLELHGFLGQILRACALVVEPDQRGGDALQPASTPGLRDVLSCRPIKRTDEVK